MTPNRWISRPKTRRAVSKKSVAASKPSAADVKLTGAAGGSASTGVAYPGALADGDLSYQVTAQGVKEALILQKAPNGARPKYSWTVHAPGLELTRGKGGVIDYKDAQGKVVLQTPVPLMTDSSGVAGESTGSQMNVAYTLTKLSNGDWRFTLDPDSAWLDDSTRVYPISIDPSTITPSTGYLESYKSDGELSSYPTDIGNSNNGGYWRTAVSFPYGQILGTHVFSAQLLVEFAGVLGYESTAVAPLTGSWATTLGYNCPGPYASGSSLGTDEASIDMTGFFQNAADSNDGGRVMCLQGGETPGAFSFKTVYLGLWIQFEGKPIVNGSPTSISDPNTGFPSVSSAPGATPSGPPTSTPPVTSLTPVLNVNGAQDGSNTQPLNYQFFVGTNPSPFPNMIWNTPWMGSTGAPNSYNTSAQVPQGVLQPNTRYYWQSVTADEYGIQGWSPIYSFTTTTLPTFGAAGAYSPADQSIVATTTPTLTAPLATATNGKTLSYELRITTGTDGASGQIAQSPLCATTGSTCVLNSNGTVSWQVPASILSDGGSYTWALVVNDGYGDYIESANSLANVNRLQVNLRITDPGPAPTETAGPVTVNLANGNVSASFSSPTVNTVGGPMGVNFNYNSQLAANQGFTGTYYNLPSTTTAYSYTTLPSTSSLVRTDTDVNFDWGSASPDAAVPSNYYQVQWNGFISPPSGTYAFGFKSDDGVELSLNHTAIITDQWIGQSSFSPPVKMETGTNQVLTVTGSNWTLGTQSGTLPLPVAVNYYQINGPAFVYFEVQQMQGTTWQPSQVVPATWLSKSAQMLPSGWGSSSANLGDAGEYVSASNQGGSVVITDADGGTHTFTKTSTGGYTPPAGEESVLTTDQSGNLVFTDESGIVYLFSAAGQVISVTPPVDAGAKPATPVPGYNASNQLTTISDPLSNTASSGSTPSYGRQLQLFYVNNTTIASSAMNGSNPAAGACAPPSGSGFPTTVTQTAGSAQSDSGMLCQIVYPDGTTTQLYYDANGQLAEDVDPGSVVTNFGYTPSSASGRYLLSAIRNSLANDWLAANTARNPAGPVATTVTYDSQDRGTSVTLPAPDGVTTSLRPKKTFTYATSIAGGATGKTYVDVAGISAPTTAPADGHDETVTFNQNLQQLTDSSASGLTSQTLWNSHDNQLASIDPQGHESSTVYDTQDRATDQYGPAPAACFGATASLPFGPTTTNANGGPDAPTPASTCAAMGTTAVAHTQTTYDGGMHGLNASWYNNVNVGGVPAAYSLGTPAATGAVGGTTNGSIDYNWDSTGNASVPVTPITGPTGVAVGTSTGNAAGTNWTAQFTGLLTFPTTGAYTIYTYADDGTQLWLNDSLVSNMWTGGALRESPTYTVNATAGEVVRIRLNYLQNTGPAQLVLAWAPPGTSPATTAAAATPIPAGDLSPAYNLVTSTTTADSAPTGVAGVTNTNVPSQATSTSYSNPWFGTVASTSVDPAGQDLTSTATTEAPGSGYMRQLTGAKPAGTATTTTSTYYGGTGSSAAPAVGYGAALGLSSPVCGVPLTTLQDGLLEKSTGPTPASGAAAVTEYVYDVFGRVAGTLNPGDTAWSCTTYDARGRVASNSYPAFGSTAARTVTYGYAGDGQSGSTSGDPLTTWEQDGSVTGSPNGSRITTVTNLDGQQTSYRTCGALRPSRPTTWRVKLPRPLQHPSAVQRRRSRICTTPMVSRRKCRRMARWSRTRRTRAVC